MHSIKANSAIKLATEEIKSTLRAFADAVDESIAKTDEETRKASEVLRDMYAEQEIRRIRQKTRDSIDLARGTATTNILASFDTIERTVNEWVAEPVSPTITSFANMFHDTGMKIGQEELSALSVYGAGSYFGARLLSEIAAQNGLMFKNFDPLPVILRKIRGAKTDCLSCLEGFAGSIGKDHKIAGAWLMNETTFKQPWSAEFIARLDDASHNSFESITSKLLEMSDPTITLLPSESERMAKLFEGKTGEDVVDTMIELQKNRNLREKLRLYDADLYDRALQKKRDIAYQISKKAEKAAQQSVSAMMDAKKEAAKAEADIAENASKK